MSPALDTLNRRTTAINSGRKRQSIESDRSFASTIVRFGRAQDIRAVPDREMADESGLVGDDLSGITGILSEFVLDILLGENDPKVSSLGISYMDVDVLTATKDVPGLRIQSGEHVEWKSHCVIRK